MAATRKTVSHEPCEATSPKLALLVAPLQGDALFWAFGYGPYGSTYRIDGDGGCEEVPQWRIRDELTVSRYFAELPERTFLHPRAQVRYVDDQGVGRLGQYIEHHGGSVTVQTQCGYNQRVPIHALRIPTKYDLMGYPVIVGEHEILYRYSMGPVRIWDSSYLGGPAPQCGGAPDERPY